MKLPYWLEHWGFIAACVILPTAWGWLVNWAFERWHARSNAVQDESTFTDYQI